MAGQLLRELVMRYVPTPWCLRLKRLQMWAVARRAPAGAGGAPPLAPPVGQALVFGADPGFQVIGAEYLRYFRELGGLQPSHKVLEVGCGIGRIAVALAGYLSADGEYRGFDIAREGIAWCRENITPRHPHFRFDWADVYNKTYNPRGTRRAAEFTFPYEDGRFDVVYTTSVFTHMLAADLARYLAESARVLKRGGRCLHTFFLLNDETAPLMAAGRSLFKFAYALEGCRTVSRVEPEKAVAYDEARVRALFADCGLRILEPIRYGGWCGRPVFLSGQDIVLAAKP